MSIGEGVRGFVIDEFTQFGTTRRRGGDSNDVLDIDVGAHARDRNHAGRRRFGCPSSEFEAVGLALVGGAAGVALSLLVATVLLVASPELPFRMTPSMTPSMVGLALIIRMMTGAVSGWLPARRASRPDPATAIRARR